MRMMFPILLMLCCAISSLFGQNQSVLVDLSLSDKVAVDGKAPCIVLMKDRLVFHKPLPFQSKLSRATHVYTALVNHAQKSQADLTRYLTEQGRPFRSFYVTNAISLTVDQALLDALVARKDIERIIDDAPVKMLQYEVDRSANNARGAEPEWGLQMIKADSVWQMGIRGKGVVVAGQDTGYDWKVSPIYRKYKGYIDSIRVDHRYHWHDAIHKNNPRFPETDLNPCGYSTSEPCDDDNHGTHTMGTMVGEDDANSIGVAPEASWIACRNMDRGWGQPSTYMECFEWFLAPFDEKGENADPSKSPHVINNSWYCSEEEGCNLSNLGMMNEIVSNLKASGVVVVVSAGNSGSQGCGSVTGPPAFFEPSFSVGATTREDNIAGFSSRGPVVIDSSFRLKPNVAAPGAGVRSVVRGGGFAAFSGTSMAGPHVAGLVALIISANPSLAGRPEIIEDIIESTATPKTSTQDCLNFPGMTVPNAIFGHGRVNALAAVRKAMTFPSGTTTIIETTPLYVLPNPATDQLFIGVDGEGEKLLSVQLISPQGQVVMQYVPVQEQSSHLLSVGHLPPGLYYVSAETQTGQKTGKVVIVK